MTYCGINHPQLDDKPRPIPRRPAKAHATKVPVVFLSETQMVIFAKYVGDDVKNEICYVEIRPISDHMFEDFGK